MRQENQLFGIEVAGETSLYSSPASSGEGVNQYLKHRKQSLKSNLCTGQEFAHNVQNCNEFVRHTHEYLSAGTISISRMDKDESLLPLDTSKEWQPLENECLIEPCMPGKFPARITNMSRCIFYNLSTIFHIICLYFHEKTYYITSFYGKNGGMVVN